MRITFLPTLLTLCLSVSDAVTKAAEPANRSAAFVTAAALMAVKPHSAAESEMPLAELSQRISALNSVVTPLRLKLSGIVAKKELISYKQANIKNMPFETPCLPLTKSVWSAQKELELDDLLKEYNDLVAIFSETNQELIKLLEKYKIRTGRTFAFPAPKSAKFTVQKTHNTVNTQGQPSLKQLLRVAQNNSLMPLKFSDPTCRNRCFVEFEHATCLPAGISIGNVYNPETRLLEPLLLYPSTELNSNSRFFKKNKETGHFEQVDPNSLTPRLPKVQTQEPSTTNNHEDSLLSTNTSVGGLTRTQSLLSFEDFE